MCISALTGNGAEILANDAVKGENYFCKECEEKLILKKGNHRCHHFAHQSESDCSFTGGGETEKHYLMKYAIKKIIEEEIKPSVSHVEHWIGSKKADYYFELEYLNSTRKVAVECVYKHTSYDDYLEKRDYYQREGIYCIWLFEYRLLVSDNKEQQNHPTIRLTDLRKDIVENQNQTFQNKDSLLIINIEEDRPQLGYLHLRDNKYKDWEVKRFYKEEWINHFHLDFYDYQYVEVRTSSLDVKHRKNVLVCGEYLAKFFTDYLQDYWDEESIQIKCERELASANPNRLRFTLTSNDPSDYLDGLLCGDCEDILGRDLNIAYDVISDVPDKLYGTLYNRQFQEMRGNKYNNFIGKEWERLRNKEQFQYKTIPPQYQIFSSYL